MNEDSKKKNARPSKSAGLTSFIKKGDLKDSPGFISTALPYNMGAGARQLDLFDELNEKDQALLKKSDEAYIIDRNGRRIAVTALEKKCIYALGVFISQYMEDEDLKTLIKDESVDKKLTKKEFSINVKDLANFIFHRGKTEQQDKIREILNTLASKRQVIELYSPDKKKRLVFEAPLIKLEESIRIENLDAPESDKIETNIIHVTFGSTFFWNMNKRYAYFPVRLFEIWHKKGSGTESNLFDVLLETLLYHRWHCITAYKSAKKNFDDELKSKGQNLPKEEYQKELQRRQENALTYRESLKDILDRVETKYSSYYRKGRLESDLQKAVDVLKGEYVNIITHYKKEETNSNIYLYFRYNVDYGRKETPFVPSNMLTTEVSDTSSEDKKSINEDAEKGK